MVVRRDDGPATVHLIGVSIPRSGHNFLVRMLAALYPLDLSYCEYYGVAGCCRAVPCARRGALPITFQKTHDFELDVPRDVAGALYVVLHRAPVPAALSARELYADDYGEAVAGDRGEYAAWLGRQAEYYVTFWERWLERPPARSVTIDYDDLARDPAGTLKIVLGAAGLEAEEGAIRAAVAKTVPHGGLYGERPYVPRSIERSRYLDRELLAAYESIILDHLPGLAERRVLDPVEDRETVTGRVFAALRAQRGGDVEGAIGILDRAIEAEPGNALLHHERAALLLAQRRFGEAWASAERAMRLAPTHRPILEAAVTAALAAGDPSTVVEPMERLFALVEPTLVGRLKLALVRMHGGDWQSSGAVLAEVERELPDDAEAWRVAAEIRRARGEPELALAAVETAIRLAPLQGEPYAYRGELLLEAGRPDEAVGALRSALVIDAGQRGWWALLVRAQREAGDAVGALAAAHEAVGRCPEDAELQAELAALRERAPDADPAAGPHDDLARLRIELAQVRAALGVAERRSYELEVRRHRQVSESWDQSHKLDEALQEKERAMQEAWEQARRLDVSLQEKEQAMQAAWAQSRLLDEALQEKEQSMQAAWAWTEKLDGRARRLRAALEQLDENAPVLREKWV